jgi:hypothetical protein
MNNNETKRIDLICSWKWTPDRLICFISKISGGTFSSGIKNQIINLTLDLDKNSKGWLAGNNLNNYLHSELPEPQESDFGTKNLIQSYVGETSSITLEKDMLKILYWVEYDNKKKERIWYKWNVRDLPIIVSNLLSEINNNVNDNMEQHFLSEYGNGQINSEKWKAEKKKVFISYRSDKRELVDKLVVGLGNYGNQSFFIPSTDYLDLQAGNWLEQLKTLIQDCDIFIPILTKEYLEGPVTKPELDMALRQHYSNTNKKIIPILIEGNIKDYENTWLGGFHIIKISNNINSEEIDMLANLALGISKNPYR